MADVKAKAVAKPVAKTTAAKAVETKTAQPAETKEVAAKTEKKAEPKKTAAKATTTKKAAAEKAPAKKATTKKATEVKAGITLEFDEKSYTTEKLVEIAKDVWVYDLGKDINDFKTVELYVKPAESAVYYVVNEEVTGCFGI